MSTVPGRRIVPFAGCLLCLLGPNAYVAHAYVDPGGGGGVSGSSGISFLLLALLAIVILVLMLPAALAGILLCASQARRLAGRFLSKRNSRNRCE